MSTKAAFKPSSKVAHLALEDAADQAFLGGALDVEFVQAPFLQHGDTDFERLGVDDDLLGAADLMDSIRLWGLFSGTSDFSDGSASDSANGAAGSCPPAGGLTGLSSDGRSGVPRAPGAGCSQGPGPSTPAFLNFRIRAFAY
jgi:hypothetical protein